MQQLRVRNHYVPELYLKQWEHEGRISTYRLLVPHDSFPLWEELPLKSIAFRRHLYTSLIGQEETDEIERWLDREFESPAQEAISRVINEQRLTPDHWRHLVRFAVAQDVRTPARLKEFLSRQKETLKPLMDKTLAQTVNKLERSVNENQPLQVNEMVGAGEFPLKITIEKPPVGNWQVQAETMIGRGMWLWNIKHLLTSTLKRIPRQQWTVLHAPAGISWPTSDNPLIRLNYQDASNYDFGGGWGVKNTDILLPLSPKHLLHTSIGKRSWLRGTVLEEGMARILRKIIIQHADRYIFSLDPSDVHLIRPRLVCSETYKGEEEAWQNWHSDQCQAEAELRE
ncbi:MULTISPECIES: DUF4238 domain-containing protein [Gammaproteobacteria]|jgi:hypothetical protein|uniref:DUF4238 domain-containing protein n=1 Tax=Gammaproteobacteria TaxID=1236 RepID=UPI0019122591|nr:MULTISPECIES: DUF4238 domain-containing protein [Gammaproteobacteria]MBK5299706.1 DUF4238 domain-containing protein [Bacillus sp. TH86]MBK5319475.1 DUF4238 domain-containing protein [Bacillus sp. TH59]MBK5334425.1 DUF4238 domain-containing protein [Bacillus sp. TH57]MBK5308515.1 DUF4238 domain-containing protein [Pseudomonas sp. TH71]MBK5313974.1 DUF4238 domain-containing protein [Erwinia sp. TH79]